MIRSFGPVASIVAALAASIAATPAVAKGPELSGAWVRLPAATGRPAAGYFTLKGGDSADRLVAATSPRAERIELHSMVMHNGVMRMRAETGFDVPAGGALAFAPGGNHLMLFGLDSKLKPGDRIPVTLRFQSGATLGFEAEARAVTAAAHGGHKGH